jgi:O-antigen ligase
VFAKMTRCTTQLRAATVFAIPFGMLVYPLLGGLAFLGFLALSRAERPWPLTVPSLTVFVALLFSALVSPWPLQAWQGVLGALAIGLTLVLLMTRMQPSDRPAAFLGLAAGLTVFGLTAVHEVFVVGAPRAAGLTFHANVAGGLMVIGTLALLGSFQNVQRTLPRLVVLTGLVGGLAALALSESRGAYLGLAVGLVGFAMVRLAQDKGRRLALFLGLAALAVLTVGLEPLFDAFLRRADLGADPLNPMGRTFMWLLALELAAQRPFLGYGFGAWRELIPIIEPTFPIDRLEHAHNLYLQLVLDGGSLSLVALLCWLAWLAKALLARSFAEPAVVAAAFAALLGTLAHNLVDVTLYHLSLAGLLWTFVALGWVHSQDASASTGAARMISLMSRCDQMPDKSQSERSESQR